MSSCLKLLPATGLQETLFHTDPVCGDCFSALKQSKESRVLEMLSDLIDLSIKDTAEDCSLKERMIEHFSIAKKRIGVKNGEYSSKDYAEGWNDGAQKAFEELVRASSAAIGGREEW
jgi:hypothetical protein